MSYLSIVDWSLSVMSFSNLLFLTFTVLFIDPDGDFGKVTTILVFLL